MRKLRAMQHVTENERIPVSDRKKTCFCWCKMSTFNLATVESFNREILVREVLSIASTEKKSCCNLQRKVVEFDNFSFVRKFRDHFVLRRWTISNDGRSISLVSENHSQFKSINSQFL